MAFHENEDSQFVTMNLAGRFAGTEIKRYGQQVIKHILTEKDIALFFGQQTNFRPALPKHFEYIGNTRAFLVYNKEQYKVYDERKYKHYLKDLELQGKLPKHYLPETNFVVCKVKTRSSNKPKAEFIAVSYLTDECYGKLRASTQMKTLLTFVEKLSQLENLPVVVGGTYRLPLEDAKSNMTEDFRCRGYLPANKRRKVRAASFYLCSRSFKLTDVKPIVCSKIEMSDNPNEKWLNPEDAFYWDPVIANFVRPHPPSPRRPRSPEEVIIETHIAPVQTSMQTSVQNSMPVPELNGHQNGAPLATNGEALTVPDEADGMIRRIPSYVELYDEELMETNAGMIDTPTSQLPVIWKLERIHFLLMAFIEELQVIQLELEKPKIMHGAKHVEMYDTVWY